MYYTSLVYFYLLIIFAYVCYGFNIQSTNVPFIQEVYNINVNTIDMETVKELQYLFKVTPVLIFKNQTLTPKQHIDFCKLFDTKSNDNVIHPFKDTQVPDYPQLAIRGKGFIKDTFGVKNTHIQNTQTFKYNKVWHQDLVGSRNVLPTIVSSMYMLKTPEKGGSTLFASLEKGYENFNFNFKFLSKIKCCYSAKSSLSAQIDHTGYGRLDKYWKYDINELSKIQDDLVIQPLVIYPDSNSIKKTLMISPNKFYSFLGMEPKKSQELMREILNKCIFVENNIGEVFQEENDLIIFNNRKVIHTSTPTEAFEEDRIFSLLFLNTKEHLH